MVPTETERARWEEALAGLAHRIETAEGYLLALVVGAGDGLREAFARDMAARLAPRFEVRPVEITAKAPNPLQPLMDLAGIENVVVVPYGLAELSTEERKHTLHLLNWSRSQLTRRPMKVVLWVEPDVVAELYQFAGDFADWWSELVELPATAPEPRADPFAGRSRWALLEELEARWAAYWEAESSGALQMDSAWKLEKLGRAVEVRFTPGQTVAGARLIRHEYNELWRGMDLESGKECLIRVVSVWRDYAAFLVEVQALRDLAAMPDGPPRGIARLLNLDRGMVAYSISLPVGGSLSEGVSQRRWSTEHRVRVVCGCIDAMLAVESVGCLLRSFSLHQVMLDAEDSPVLLLYDIVGRLGDRSDGHFYHVISATESHRDRVVSKALDVYMMGLLLVFVVTGRKVVEATLQDMESSADFRVSALGRVARRATAFKPEDRYADLEAFRQAVTHAMAAAAEDGKHEPVMAATSNPADAGLSDRVKAAGRRWTNGTWASWGWAILAVLLLVMWARSSNVNQAALVVEGRLDVAQQQIVALEKENAALKEEVQTLKDYIRLLKEQQNTLP